ncbi:hypothetical protein ABH920_001684 [Catenulispora sp. EB89]|uniref:hypothetical protein n=1 Tax=Catenulispora sp. EB89 TaxID=3156257 RepID=UPI003517757A
MDNEITRLETELAGLTGSARAQTLLRLGQAHWMRYWRTGIGSGVGLPHLDRTITAMDEALGYLEPGDVLRVQAVSMVGVFRCIRHSVHNGPTADRDAGIPLIEEALAAGPGVLPPASADFARVTLGEAYLRRSMQIMQTQDAMMAVMSRGMPPGTIADMERAIEILREVTNNSTAPQMTQMAAKMLRMAETMHRIFTAFGSPNLSTQVQAMMGSMAEIQELVRELETDGFGMGSHITNASVLDTEWTQYVDTTDIPSAMFREAGSDAGGDEPKRPESAQPKPAQPQAKQPEPQPPEPKRPQPERPESERPESERPESGASEQPEQRERPERARFSVDAEAIRADLRTLIGAASAGDAVFAVAADLLRAAEPPAWVDEFVASAAGVVHSVEAPSGTDHFLLAVALHLRSRRDGDDDGWGDGSGGADAAVNGDAQAAVASLLTAAQTVPDEDPDAIPTLVQLAQLSPDGALKALGSRLGGLTTLLQSVGAEAVELPEPTDSLRWNAVENRFEPAAEPCEARTLVVVDGGSLRESKPSASEDDVTVSYVASLSQLRTLSRRKVRPVAQEPVFVANPRGDRMPAAVETMLLRRSFYPHSVGLGGLIEAADGAGTAKEVRARLEASVLHLACGVTESGALELADSTELDLTDVEVEHGGVTVLPPDHFQPLADILLAAGFTGVVGWRRPVPEDFGAVAYFLLHTELADVGRAPAAAVRAVREQLRAPDLGALPPLLASRFEAAGGAAGDDWTALVYRGR